MRLKLLLACLSIVSAIVGKGQSKIALSGIWSVQLDPDSVFYRNNKPPLTFDNQIQLPGTTDEAQLGYKTSGSDYGILTRAYKHIGPAWYQKKINIPVSWDGKIISLYLERVLWESKVYVDGRLISTLSPLYVPHRHTLGELQPGSHTLTICVNNDLIHNIGDKGHGYTEYTQSIWNGIVGKMELQKEEDFAIRQVKTYPDADTKRLHLQLFLSDLPTGSIVQTVTIKEVKTGKLLKKATQITPVKMGINQLDFIIKDLHQIKLWDEFDPNLYEVNLVLKKGEKTAVWKDNIGFRKLAATQHKIQVNGKTTFIRGNLDCVHFPLTGYPSTDTKDWEAIFKKYKEYGLNTVRFHSWTPPKAAFEAADKLGIYIQTEIIWLDWWMASEQKSRPEMNTKGYPQGLGKNPNADKFVQEEMKRVLDEYGNHPSFVFFCIGNELGNSDFEVMQKWIEKVKKEDPRHMYAVSTARKIMPVDDYMVTHHIPGIGGTYGYSLNKTDAGLETNYNKAAIPIIAHEVGQVPVYPEWNEIYKYTGVLKARNLEGFKAIAEKNGIEKQDKDFHRATGALQQLLYKNLIENITLAPSSAGFQMLSLTDYQGQGEALIGWLDCFWEDKGTTSPEVFKGYSNAVVPLIRTSTFTYTDKDTLIVSLEVANNYKAALQKTLLWKIMDENGKLIDKGTARNNIFPQGQLTVADNLSLPLKKFPKEAAKYTFTLYFEDNSYSNQWDFFVFPSADSNIFNTTGIYISEEWNKSVDSVLANGGKVLLLANKLGSKKTSAPVNFTPLFWSASFFPGQNNETLGSLINNNSEAFRYFPTSYFTNWQWLKSMAGAKYFKLTDLHQDIRPLFQPVSDFHYNEKLGSIFETKIGDGKLMVCGFDLNQKDNAYSRQLFYSLVQYMKGNGFNPSSMVPADKLKEVLIKVQEAVQEIPIPGEFAAASVFIKAGAKAKESKIWEPGDDLVVSKKQYAYSLDHAKIVNSDSLNAWGGRAFTINLRPPAGVKGYIYLHMVNPTGKKSAGSIIVEGRELLTGSIPQSGKWIKLFMMREDTNDGILSIQLNGENNSSIMLDQFAIIEED